MQRKVGFLGIYCKGQETVILKQIKKKGGNGQEGPTAMP